MGFLDNLLKKETRKIISGAVDSVVDNVMDNIKGAIRGSNSSAEAKASPNVSIKVNGRTIMEHGRENETGDDADCCFDENVVGRRIEMIAAEDWPGYELRRNIPATELGADEQARSFDYGLYLDGQPKVMIMLLDHYQYRSWYVQRSHIACRNQGVGSFHLLMHLPNRKTYIAERVKAVMPS
ncbi:MAG: hypothetical protein NC123_04265 [Butyrivibrio sp.]|nr:hypothetical protein [Acetatifactor muris]MCM1558742.1 hypothetical protein [Butyrivibrio sp.]